MKKILKNPIVCIILGGLFVLAAILFAPFWIKIWEKCPWGTWGEDILDILIAVLIVLYLIFFLSKKIKRNGKRVIQVLTIIEFSLLSLIALGCIFSQAKIIPVDEVCQIFALAIWTRGSVELFRAYYYRADSKEIYPVWYLALSIAMVSFGAFTFAKPFIANKVILWIFVASLAILGIVLLGYGINAKKNKTPITNKE